tara:strand:- start:19076 stop:19258 length:183 start_codon:yes stop_codon:yes gene_type:complete
MQAATTLDREWGQARGDIRQNIDPASKAKVLLVLAIAVRVLGRCPVPWPLFRRLPTKQSS